MGVQVQPFGQVLSLVATYGVLLLEIYATRHLGELGVVFLYLFLLTLHEKSPVGSYLRYFLRGHIRFREFPETSAAARVFFSLSVLVLSPDCRASLVLYTCYADLSLESNIALLITMPPLVNSRLTLGIGLVIGQVKI